MKYALGIDIGGTEIKIALINRSGVIKELRRVPHNTPSDAKTVIDGLVNLIISLLKSAGMSIRDLEGIGVASAGDIDYKKGIVRFTPNFGWRNVPIKKYFNRYFKIPIVTDNDANAASWAAYCIEFKQKIDNLICVALGTGVGGGLILNRKIFHGATGTAGEIGHIVIHPGGEKCNCGNYGCVEVYIGAKYGYIVNTAKKEILSGRKSIITELINNDFSILTPKIITMAAKQNDSLAIEVLKKAGSELGIALANVVNLLNPEAIVLAGGISKSGKYILDPVKETIKKCAFKTPAEKVKVVISKLQDRLGVIGAGCLILYPY